MARPHARSKPAEGNHLQGMAVFIGASNDLSQGVASKRGVGFHKNCPPSGPKRVLETRRSFLTTLLDEAVRPSFPSLQARNFSWRFPGGRGGPSALPGGGLLRRRGRGGRRALPRPHLGERVQQGAPPRRCGRGRSRGRKG